jgi:hypothetical protein
MANLRYTDSCRSRSLHAWPFSDRYTAARPGPFTHGQSPIYRQLPCPGPFTYGQPPKEIHSSSTSRSLHAWPVSKRYTAAMSRSLHAWSVSDIQTAAMSRSHHAWPVSKRSTAARPGPFTNGRKIHSRTSRSLHEWPKDTQPHVPIPSRMASLQKIDSCHVPVPLREDSLRNTDGCVGLRRNMCFLRALNVPCQSRISCTA